MTSLEHYSGFNAGKGVPEDIQVKVVDMVDRCFAELSKQDPHHRKGGLQHRGELG